MIGKCEKCDVYFKHIKIVIFEVLGLEDTTWEVWKCPKCLFIEWG